MSDRERRVRDEAYRIWEEAGRPQGQDDRHWLEAERRVAVAEREGPKPGAGPKRAPRAPLKATPVEVGPSAPGKVASGGKAARKPRPDKASSATPAVKPAPAGRKSKG